MNEKKPILSEYFERLKALVPEIYPEMPDTGASNVQKEDVRLAQLLELLKKSLGVIEAVYLQGSNSFHTARAEVYSSVVQELNALGYSYEGNRELLEKAARQVIAGAKKPMEKAKGERKDRLGKNRKAM